MNILYILGFCLIMSNNFKTLDLIIEKQVEVLHCFNTCAANWPVENAGYTGPPKIAKQSFYLFIPTVFEI